MAEVRRSRMFGGPWLTGLVADNSSLNTGLLVSIVFPVMMLVGVALFAKKPKEN